jgi:3'5'-cyclic nucleotide phosphodiesterase
MILSYLFLLLFCCDNPNCEQYGITSDPLTHFGILFATLIHDVDHTGCSNPQRGKEEPELAEKYRNRSIAEQNSVDLAWGFLMQYKNLQACIWSTPDELIRFRHLVVNLVMATDIFDKDLKATRNTRWDKIFHSNMEESVEGDEFRNLKAAIVIEHIVSVVCC